MSLQASFAKILEFIDPGFRKCSNCGDKFFTGEGLRRHREIEHGDNIVLFKCTECGKIKRILPELHAHAEKHTGFFSFGNVSDLMKYTEKLEVTGYENLEPGNKYPYSG